jgi:hypothetical protein
MTEHTDEDSLFDVITLQVEAKRGEGYLDRSGFMNGRFVVIKGRPNSYGSIYSYSVYIDSELFQKDIAGYPLAEQAAWREATR